MTQIILMTEYRQFSQKLDKVWLKCSFGWITLRSSILLFVQRKIRMFLLERKPMNNHKERWNTFSTHSEWNFLQLRVEMAFPSSQSESRLQSLHPTWLKGKMTIWEFHVSNPLLGQGVCPSPQPPTFKEVGEDTKILQYTQTNLE